MTPMKSMFDGILPSDESVLVPVSVTLNIPYLGVTYADVAQTHVEKLLSAALSILLARYTDKPLNKEETGNNVFGALKIDGADSIEKYVSDTDDYEMATMETTIVGIVDYDEVSIGVNTTDFDYESWRIKTEQDYEKIIEETIALFEEYLIKNPMADVEPQMEILLACFDSAGEIIVKSQNYYEESGLLWLSVAG